MNGTSRPAQAARNPKATTTGSLHGVAVIFLRDGRAYEGAATIEERFVTVHGRRRLNTGFEVRYGIDGVWTWPTRQLREVRWRAEAAA